MGTMGESIARFVVGQDGDRSGMAMTEESSDAITNQMRQAAQRLEEDMANFRPKRPITQNDEYFYPDTLENFLKIRKLKKGGDNEQTYELPTMWKQTDGEEE